MILAKPSNLEHYINEQPLLYGRESSTSLSVNVKLRVLTHCIRLHKEHKLYPLYPLCSKTL